MIDIENETELRSYLVERFPELAVGERSGERISMSNLHGGVSNRTVRVRLPAGREWVVKQALERLRVPVEWYCSPDRIHREALGIELLGGLLPAGSVPALVFEDSSHHLLAMEAVREPFENWKTMLLSGRLDAAQVQEFARMLAAVHAGGLRERRRLPAELSDRTYFRNLRLEPYYRFVAERLPAARRMLEELSDECDKRELTIVHGDFSPKNILLRRGRMILLDHEVIHLGDPAFDLGFSLTHLLSKAHHLPGWRTAFLGAARAYWSEYLGAAGDAALDEWGADFAARVVRHTMGCLLARAAGRSQLEYLSGGEKARQVAAVEMLVAAPPPNVEELIERFGQAVEEE